MGNSQYFRWSSGLTSDSEKNGHREKDAATRLMVAREPEEGAIEIMHSPKYVIEESAKIYCIGSCFAREIEKALVIHGISVTSNELNPDKFGVVSSMHPSHRAPVGIMTKFNSFSMGQEIQRVVKSEGVEEFPSLVKLDSGEYWDSQLHNVPPQSLNTMSKIRRMVDANLQGLCQADVVVLTLGLTEMWWDKDLGIALNGAPYKMKNIVKSGVGRYEFRNASFEEVRSNLIEMINNLRKLNSSVKVLLTVSPVPLQRTFSGVDVIVANSHSKSLLRSVIADVESRYASVDYFPSYEIVSNSSRRFAWQHDQRHVNPKLIKKITQKFIEGYILQDTDLSLRA